MRKPKDIGRRFLCILTLTLIFFQLNYFYFDIVYGSSHNVPGFSFKGKVYPNETASYQFSNNIKLDISTNVLISINIEFDKSIKDRHSSINIENNKPISLEILSYKSMSEYGYKKEPKTPSMDNTKWKYDYHFILRFKTNTSIQKITVRFEKSEKYGLDPNKDYSIAYYNEDIDSWEIIDTEQVSIDNTAYLEASVSDTEAEKEYYFTILEQELDYTWIWIIVIIAVSILALVIAISKADFLDYLKKRYIHIDKGAHRLTMDEVLENENRNKIIELILKEPGIHFNELLRKTGLAAGNLVWHLDILETYKIIGKKRIGNYIAYFPYYPKNPISNLDLKLSKSKLTLEILEMIESEPGIWNSLITKRKKVDHKTIQYHIKKLIDLGLVVVKKEGRKKKLYPNLDSDYFKKNNK
ncbi:MAG: winged helix-turn-helix transcriptional regulator [Promethearchaeia archaeon]